MLNTDEDALFCDIAETYHLFDWSAVSVQTLARLASGLRDDSRIVMKLSGMKVPMKRLLLAMIADNTSFVAWANTENAHNHPDSPPPKIVPAMLGIKKHENENSVQAFRSAEEFEKRLAELRSG